MAESFREARRKEALRLKQAGRSQKEIAEALGVTEGAVSQWMKRVREGGEEALAEQPRPGSPPRLGREQLAKLPMLLLQGPEAYGFSGEIWTAGRVAEVIRREFGVRYHETHVRRLLAKVGWTSQTPEVEAGQRNEERIEQWRDVRWRKLKKKR